MSTPATSLHTPPVDGQPSTPPICARCQHVSDLPYCPLCGLGRATPSHPGILQDNQWQVGADEFAVCFLQDQLTGIFRRALRVPVGTRAWIMQAGNSQEVPPGEYELEGFFARLNNLLRAQPATIVITRQAPFVLDFVFQGMPSAEFLPLDARLSLSIQVEQLASFARYFAMKPGVMTSEALQALLAGAFRQSLAEFLASYSLQELTANQQLRLQIDERLQSACKHKLAQLGLCMVALDSIYLHHEKLDAQRTQQASVVLLQEHEQNSQRAAQQLAKLYDARAWHEIEERRAEIERGLQQQQLQQQSQQQSRQLAQEQSLEHAERMLALRCRKIELLGRITQADSEQQALQAGASDALRDLQQEMAEKQLARLDARQEWQHVRALASIKMQTELAIAAQNGREEALLLAQEWQIRHAQLAQGATVEQALLAKRHQARLALFDMQLRARQQEAQRIAQLKAQWETAQQAQQLRALLRQDALADAEQGVQLAQWQQQAAHLQRQDARADASAQQEKLQATLALQDQFARQRLQQQREQQLMQLEAAEKTMLIRQQEEDQRWQRSMQQQASAQQARAAHWQAEQEQALELARLETTRLGVIGNLSDTAKLAVVAPANAALLAEVMKTQLHAQMQSAQIAASQAHLQSGQTQTPWDTQRENLADKERQHQLALLSVQQAQQAPPTSGKTCLHGHANTRSARFCSECGAALLD